MVGLRRCGAPFLCGCVDLRAGSTVSDVSLIGDYQHEIIDSVTVYYGSDMCDSDDLEESDWEDPDDVARQEHVDDYNFDLLEGMEPMVFVPRGKTSGLYRQNEYQSYMYDDFVQCYKVIDSRLGRMASLDWDDIWGLPNNSLGSRLDMRPYCAL